STDDDDTRWHEVKSEAASIARPEFAPDDPVVLFYTSGTTGPPKGVPLTQRNVSFQLHAVIDAGLVDADDRVMQPLPPHHVYPLIVGTLAPLALGITVVIPEAMLGPQIVAALRAENVSFIVGVPRLYEALVAAIESRVTSQKGLAGIYLRTALGFSTWLRRRTGWRFGKALLFPLHKRLAPKLKVLASGGAALDPVIALKIESFGWQVASGYGLTETSPLLTINPPGNGRLASVGRPVPGIELRIDTNVAGTDDSADGRDASEGEILAHGDGVFTGYLNHERDAESFTADGWFRTADLGRLDQEGYLYITGRRNTLLVTSAGKNIQPDELEQRYAEHELIDEIGLLMDDRQLAAVVVPAMSKLIKYNVSAENGVRMALSQAGRDLASYKRVSRHVLSRDPLPRTRLGKIQRHKLAALYSSLKANPEHKAPRSMPTPIEEMSAADQQRLQNSRAAAVWTLLSERYPEHGLTLDSSVQMDLGIDSLGWLELGAEIGQRAGTALDEEQIAAIETVRDLLDAVAAGGGGIASSETPIANPDAYLNDDQRRWLTPLSPVSRGLANSLYAVHRALIRSAFSLEVEGLENIPMDRQWIIAPNHASFLDPSIIAAALPKEALEKTYWAGWTGYAFRNFLFRGISRLAQVVPIDPERAATSSLAFAAAVLDRGKDLVLFPEGERSATGELLALKPGVGLLTSHFKRVVIVPAWIKGSLEAWPRDRRLPRLTKISVVFGQCLEPQSIIANSSEDGAASAITAELKTALEALHR
ncbi:MAG: AMP-binding protein, partial [Gammaproteobacteria bacterium]